MMITVTFREMLDKGIWEEFCELKGINEWCMNEGLAESDTTETLTEEEATKLGLTIGE